MAEGMMAELKNRFGSRLREHEVLRPYSKIKVGGVADHFLVVDSLQELINAVTLAQKDGLNYRVIGQGSKIIISDIGFPGLIIVNQASKISFLTEKSQVIIESGVRTSQLLMASASRDLGGLEGLALVPGTVGGAIYSNLSIAGVADKPTVEISDLVKKITVLNFKGETLTYSGSWLKSGKEQGKFRQATQKPIILTVVLQLYRSRKEDIIRRIQQFDFNEEKFQQRLVDVFINPVNVSASELITQSGAWKIKVGSLSIDRKFPNTIVNKGNAKAVEVRQLIELVRARVAEKTNVMLEEAVEYVGEW